MNFDKVIEISEAELKSITDNGKYRSREEIDNVYKLMDIIKDTYCIMDMDEGGYSMDGMPGDGSYRSYRGGSYDGSYRGRGRGANRYADGRYAPTSRDGGSYRSRRMYSRDDGKDEFMEQMQELMDNAPDDQTRQSIQRMMQNMK